MPFCLHCKKNKKYVQNPHLYMYIFQLLLCQNDTVESLQTWEFKLSYVYLGPPMVIFECPTYYHNQKNTFLFVCEMMRF